MAASTTPKWARAQPARTALAAASRTVHGRRLGGTVPRTSSGDRVVPVTNEQQAGIQDTVDEGRTP